MCENVLMFQPKLFDEFIPEFTAEELDNYYDLIQKGWWDEFCEDIHFYGAEDELYRQTVPVLYNGSIKIDCYYHQCSFLGYAKLFVIW